MADSAGTSSQAGTYDPRYLRGIEHFNDAEYFESHDIWEELWTEYRGPSRLFYKGLIQAAVALHHFSNGNLHGAAKLYRSASQYLEPYRPEHLGLPLDRFLRDFRHTFEALESPAQGVVPRLDPGRRPRITLVNT